LKKSLKKILYQIPNLPAKDVHAGKDELDNKEIKKWGEIPKIFF